MGVGGTLIIGDYSSLRVYWRLFDLGSVLVDIRFFQDGQMYKNDLP